LIKVKANIVIKANMLVKNNFHFTLFAVYIGMNINKKEFIANLDSVLELFQQFKEKMIRNNTSLDHNFMQNFDEIIRNYQIIREEIPDELISRYGMPIQIMALQLVDQLRHELEERRVSNRQRNIKSSIDDLLQEPGLSEKEINTLLDKRITLVKSNIGL
jgi:hypothetical protein